MFLKKGVEMPETIITGAAVLFFFGMMAIFTIIFP